MEQPAFSQPPVLPSLEGHMVDFSDPTAPGISMSTSAPVGLSSLDDLLTRDRQRELDGFPRKIRLGKLIKPGNNGADGLIIVPTVTEEKFIHDTPNPNSTERQMGGSGAGKEGEVIGEQPVRPDQDGQGSGSGQGQEANHEAESNAFDLGRILTEKFDLPNLKDKGNKQVLAQLTYDLTDTYRGRGQVLAKKQTLRRILQTNIALGKVPDFNAIDTSELLITPSDRIYRVFSPEKEYQSQAMVFFVRDYSGSMEGKCTEQVVAQHVLIYSWLVYQYAKRIETRFILHDNEAKEVTNFQQYYNSRVAGGTQVSAAYKLVNEIVEKESLASQYNIYVFHGTDGDDWDTRGDQTLPHLRTMLEYASRIGISIVTHSSSGTKPDVQGYIESSGLLREKSDTLRMDVFDEDASETRLIEGIKSLLSQETQVA